MSNESQPSFAHRIVIMVAITSFLVGSISGGIFGVVAVTQPRIANWIERNILGTTSSLSTAQRSAGEGTIRIEEESGTINVVNDASPAVVSIVVNQDLSKVTNSTNPFGELFGFPFNTTPQEGLQQVGAGTGFIISSDGMIVTNKHVVNSSQGNGDATEYTVILNDGSKYDATVLDMDAFNDLALVKIEGTNLPTLELGDSETVQIGQTVIAIGNALGEFSNTVTKGVVSGLARTITAGDGQGSSETLEDIIQTDAAINFGNSGGPLLNLAGQVVGVNTAISQEGQLIGFAIPINQAKKVIESVQQFGRIVRPYLGVRYVLVTEAIAEQNALAVDYGALISKGEDETDLAVIPGSPAEKAGIAENDIILEFEGKKITPETSLVSQIQLHNPGDTVRLKILHDGQEKDISVTLEEFTE